MKNRIKINKDKMSKVRYILMGTILLILALFICNMHYCLYSPFLITIAIFFLITGAATYMDHPEKVIK